MNLQITWWIALIIQLIALPGVVLPVLPGLLLLPIGTGIWCWAVGWQQGWPPFAVALVLLLLGWGADALGMLLGAARLKASRWAYLGAGIGLMVGILGLLPALPIGGPLLGALVGPLLGASLGQLISTPSQLLLGLQVGLAVVLGMLVSRIAQALLTLAGIVSFVLLSGGLPAPG